MDQGFSLKMRGHLLDRLHGKRPGENGDYSPTDLSRVQVSDDRIYSHRRLTIHYTNYAVRRSADRVQIGTNHCDIMVHSQDDTSRYRYARVLQIYHLNVRHHILTQNQLKRMDMLFVRWFEPQVGHKSGWKVRRLDRVGFLSYGNEAFGFLDPADVIRASYIVPAFAQGHDRNKLPGKSSYVDAARDEYAFYYINR